MLMRKAALRILSLRLRLNSDCGLKTRGWKEVIAVLANMVAAAKALCGDKVATKSRKAGYGRRRQCCRYR